MGTPQSLGTRLALGSLAERRTAFVRERRMSAVREFPLPLLTESGRIHTQVAQSVSYQSWIVTPGTRLADDERRRFGRSGCMHDAHASRFLSAIGRLDRFEDFLGQMLASESSKHTVCNTARQNIRPLIDGLVTDANCVCSGRHAPAEQFDGFGLEHETLNHSSRVCATIVHGLPRTLPTMVEKAEFKDRLATAMKAANASVTDVATACDISYQAVVKLIKGASKEMSATNLAQTSKLLKVDPIWLALGEGEARPQPISADSLKPMEAQMLTMYRLLPAELQHEVDSDINSKVAQLSNTPSPANPFPNAPVKKSAAKRPLGDRAHKDAFDLSKAGGTQKKGRAREA